MTKTILEEYVQAYSEQLMCNSELTSQIMQLRKKLEIATRALKKYKEDYFITEYGGRSINPYPDIARKALKEMEGVK